LLKKQVFKRLAYS